MKPSATHGRWNLCVALDPGSGGLPYWGETKSPSSFEPREKPWLASSLRYSDYFSLLVRLCSFYTTE